MKTTRLEAFSDGVLAIIITIMVLELKKPDAVDLAALKPLLPHFVSYLLSFIYVGIYWNNHHHLFQAAQQVSGGVLWAILICCSGFLSSPLRQVGWAKTPSPQRRPLSMASF